MTNITLEELAPGTPVRFVDRVGDPDAQKCLDQWKMAHRHNKLRVHQKVDKDHVSLEDEKGNLVHFGCTHESHLINRLFLERA